MSGSDGLDTKRGLKRSISLPLLVLYGLGVTVGAGIYVLIGVTAERAGMHAPLAFLLAAVVMSFSAFSFAEMSSRFPVSAGEAAYVQEGFGSAGLAMLVGLVVIVGATISAATIASGAAGYVGELIGLPRPVLVALVVVLMGTIAALGTLESVGFAATLTVVELVGLLAIIGGAVFGPGDLLARVPEILPDGLDGAQWAGILAAGLLAFFAFVGFEDMVNVAEETRDPRRTMPAGILITLGTVTVLYVLVSSIAVLAVPIDELVASDAPLGLVFSAVAPLPPLVITLIAMLATLNGVIIQIIMASRVTYGLADRGSLPAVLGSVHPRTRTPMLATVLVTLAVLILALTLELDALAETSSRFTLVIFVLVNLALLSLKWRNVKGPTGFFDVPIWVPTVGAFLAAVALVPVG